MDRVGHGGRLVAIRLEECNRLEIRRDLIQGERTKHHGQDPAARKLPGLLRDLQLGERVAARVHRVRAQYEDEQVGLLDRLPDPVVVFVSRQQIRAVEEDGVPLGAQRQIDRFDQRAVLRRIAQEDPHPDRPRSLFMLPPPCTDMTSPTAVAA